MADLFGYVGDKYHQLRDKLTTEYMEKRRSLHGRFFLYLFLVVGSFISAAGLLLFSVGFLNPIDHDFSKFMENDLENRSHEMERYYDNLAAHNMVFSQQLTESIAGTLKKHNATIADATDNPQLLKEIQSANYEIVENNLRHNSCSGALYFIDATVNSKIKEKTYSGTYLKYAYIYSENMLTNDWSMFRGDYQIAHEHNLELFNTWQLELNLNAFEEIPDILKNSNQPLHKRFLLTKTTQLADIWERVRLMMLPIYDGQGNTIGACGYEISSVYYQLRSQPGSYQGGMILGGLIELDKDNRYVGQFNNEAAVGFSPLTLEDYGEYKLFRNDMGEFIGKMHPMNFGNKKQWLVTMMPKTSYDDMRRSANIKIGLIMAAILVLFLGSYYLFVYKYIDPLVNDLNQLVEADPSKGDSEFAEIDTVYDKLQQINQEHEERLRKQQELLQQLDAERSAAQSQYDVTANNLAEINNKQELLLKQYNILLDELQKREDELRLLQEEKKNAEEQYQTAKSSLENVLQKKWIEVDEDGYKLFVEGIDSLTAKEQEIFDFYCQGLSPKEIAARMFITENTIKFHNRNIFGKLGVKSRKELLRNIELWRTNAKN